MTRILLTYILPLVLPTVIYFCWVQYRKRTNPQAAADVPWPWFWLISGGVVLLIGSLIAWTVLTGGGADPDTQYRSPRFEDGKVVPGEFVRPPER